MSNNAVMSKGLVGDNVLTKTVFYVERGMLKPYALKEGEFLKAPGVYVDSLGLTDRELFFHFNFLGASYEECAVYAGNFAYKLDGFMVYYNFKKRMLSFFVIDTNFDEELAFFKEVVPRDTPMQESDLMTELGKYTEFGTYLIETGVMAVHSIYQLKRFIEWLNN